MDHLRRFGKNGLRPPGEAVGPRERPVEVHHVQRQHHIRGGEQFLLGARQVQRVGAGKVEPSVSIEVDHRSGQEFRQPDQVIHGRGGAPEVLGDDDRPLRAP